MTARRTPARVPVVPTLFVIAAAATMVALGFWQLGRAEEKAQMIAAYERALDEGSPRPFPAEGGGAVSEADFFHPTAFECTRVLSREAIAGRNEQGQNGFVHIARCLTERGPADVKLGWSASPNIPAYEGGEVAGLIVRGGRDGARVQLREPIAGLRPLAQPDPADLPDNHLAYAGQWFFFALTSLVIYVLALRARARREGPRSRPQPHTRPKSSPYP